MAMDASTIEMMIKEALPDAKVIIEALQDDGDHYSCSVVSKEFVGKNRGPTTSNDLFCFTGENGK